MIVVLIQNLYVEIMDVCLTFCVLQGRKTEGKALKGKARKGKEVNFAYYSDKKEYTYNISFYFNNESLPMIKDKRKGMRRRRINKKNELNDIMI